MFIYEKKIVGTSKANSSNASIEKTLQNFRR